MHGSRTEKLFSFKSFFGKYLRCRADFGVQADAGHPHAGAQFIIYETNVNEIKLFNPVLNRYVRMDDDGSVHCNEPMASSATTWTTPV